MRAATKATRSYSLDRETIAEVKRTRGRLSESERANRLLRAALEQEKRAALEREIAGFFSSKPVDRSEEAAFRSAALSRWARD